jgi:hypothetical protein
VTIRFIKGSKPSSAALTLQGFGDSEDIIIEKFTKDEVESILLNDTSISLKSTPIDVVHKDVHVMFVDVQKILHRLKNVFFPRLIEQAYGSLHLLGLSNVLVHHISSFLSVSLLFPHTYIILMMRMIGEGYVSSASDMCL